jgi:predicted ATPase/class 3 adenylate cyclase
LLAPTARAVSFAGPTLRMSAARQTAEPIAHAGLVPEDAFVAEQPSGTVTLVFTDIEGSTRLLHKLGQDAYRKALGAHREIVRGACARHGGYEVDYEGDSFFYAFPSAQGAVAAVSEAMRGLEQGPIQIRVGIHTGEPGLDPPKYVGLDVHRAARVMSAAHGGQVLLSRATRELVDVDTKDLGEHRLKNLSAPQRLYQLGEGVFPRLRTLYHTNLPVPATRFIGRERELLELGELLSHDDVHLLTLTGPGGTGKTRLAMQAVAEAAERYPDGVWWVPLAPLRDPELVLPTAARALGAKDSLAEYIGDSRMLVLLDNFEQVVEAAPGLSGLLAACPNLSVLVTSRELLRVQGEVEYPVPTLAEPEAVELFCARARLEPGEEIAELCRRLDNLPLAVELAAARTSVLSPAQILERLAQRLDLLTGGPRDVDPRQQTLRATIEWSHDLLTGPERHLFARLSVFAGGCTLDAAEQVADADLDTLQSLLEKSLIHRAGERYWMLQTIREYAGERLEQDGDAEPRRGRHLEWFLALAEEADVQSRSGDRGRWFDRLEAENDNLRAAAEWASRTSDVEFPLRLATALWTFWAERGYVSEGERRLEDALERSRTQPVRALLGRCHLRSMTGSSYTELLPDVEQAAAACELGGDRFSHVQALNLTGFIQQALGRYTESEETLERALALADGDYPAEEAEATGWLLILALYGQLPADQGIARCKNAYERAAHDPKTRAFAQVERAALEAMRGEFLTARSLLAAGRSDFRALDLKVFGANTAHEAYFVEMLAGNPAAAAVELRAGYELLEEMGERGFLSTLAGYLAHALYGLGDRREAERYSRICAEAAAEDDFLSQSLWRSVQAKLLADEREFDRAEADAREAVRLTFTSESVNTQGDALSDLGFVLHAAGRMEEAASVYRQALERYELKGNLVAAGRTRSLT